MIMVSMMLQKMRNTMMISLTMKMSSMIMNFQIAMMMKRMRITMMRRIMMTKTTMMRIMMTKKITMMKRMMMMKTEAEVAVEISNATAREDSLQAVVREVDVVLAAVPEVVAAPEMAQVVVLHR